MGRVWLGAVVCALVLGGCSGTTQGGDASSSSGTPAPSPPRTPPAPGTVGSGFDDLLVVNPSRVERATRTDLAQAEAELGASLPRGYARFVRRVGGGSLGHFVGVFSPDQVSRATVEWRERVRDYWFWDTAEAGVEREALQERGVLLASSFDGDELCFDPAEPGAFYVLPRNEDVAHRVGADFMAALQWMLDGRLNPWVEGWTFEVNDRRREQHTRLPDGTSLEDATSALLVLDSDSHLVELDGRRTVFLPQVSGRLSLYTSGGEPGVWVDLTYDDEADPDEVARVLDTISSP